MSKLARWPLFALAACATAPPAATRPAALSPAEQARVEADAQAAFEGRPPPGAEEVPVPAAAPPNAAAPARPVTPAEAAAQAGPCPAWRDHPEGVSPRYLAGVGAASLGDRDPLAQAQRRALAEIARQLVVHVKATDVTLEEAGAAGPASWDRQGYDSDVVTETDLTLEGAKLLATCAQDGTEYALVGVDRTELARRRGAEVARLADQIEAEVRKADLALRAGRHLYAALLTSSAIPLARKARARARAVEVIDPGWRAPSFPGVTRLSRKARDAAALGVVRVEVAPAGDEPLARAAIACLARAGLPASVSPSGAEATVKLDARVAAAEQPFPGLYVATGKLSALLSWEGAQGPSGAASGEAKGGGATPDAARADALARLAAEPAADVIDRLLGELGFPGPRCK